LERIKQMIDDLFYNGDCPTPLIYECEEEETLVLYTAEGLILRRKKLKLGFHPPENQYE